MRIECIYLFKFYFILIVLYYLEKHNKTVLLTPVYYTVMRHVQKQHEAQLNIEIWWISYLECFFHAIDVLFSAK